MNHLNQPPMAMPGFKEGVAIFQGNPSWWSMYDHVPCPRLHRSLYSSWNPWNCIWKIGRFQFWDDLPIGDIWGWLRMVQSHVLSIPGGFQHIQYIHVYTTIYNIDFVQSFLCNWIHVWWWGCFFQISTCRSFLWTSATQGMYKADNHSCLRVRHPLVEPHFGGVDCGYTMSSPFYGKRSWSWLRFLDDLKCLEIRGNTRHFPNPSGENASLLHDFFDVLRDIHLWTVTVLM